MQVRTKSANRHLVLLNVKSASDALPAVEDCLRDLGAELFVKDRALVAEPSPGKGDIPV